MKYVFSIFICAAVALISCKSNQTESLDLSGSWNFKIDSLNQGEAEKWYTAKLEETVELPGSMTTNGKGNKISVETKWTGQIVDSAWYTVDKYAKYRKPGNVKIPFWLQPDRHYVGAAWYQREVTIPEDFKGKNAQLYLERPHWETTLWVDSDRIGMQNSLGTPHTYNLGELTPGKHLISIRIDNAIKDINPGINAHSMTDHTQTNWNGIIGEIKLEAKPLISLQQVNLYPDASTKTVALRGKLNGSIKTEEQVILKIAVNGTGSNTQTYKEVSEHITLDSEGYFNLNYTVDEVLLWDEFTPNLYEMNLTLQSESGTDTKTISFGFRDFKAKGQQLVINDRPVFLRGTLECAVFPITGYPSTDVAEWKRIMSVVKDHGLNHVRFHSWCPPEAAFVAADELGVYIQAEASTWPNGNSSIGDGFPVDKWLYQETQDILDAYGNHPSFVLMTSGNEPLRRNHKPYLRKYVDHFRTIDNRRLYTGAADRPYLDNLDYYSNMDARVQRWGEGLNSVINGKAPQTLFDFRSITDTIPMPYVSHEIGQWCVYPNFKEMSKYTGVLKPKNFEIFKETLEEHHLGHLADSLVLASGKLQTLCYKADVEAALRTKDFGGFQLLGLSDFPGQGTALVGVLDAFWEEKGYVSPAEFKSFSGETVPLARLEKRTFLNSDTLNASVELAHYGQEPLLNVTPFWVINDTNGNTVEKGTFPAQDFQIGNGIALGEISLQLNNIKTAQQLKLSVSVEEFTNSWDIWVYPAKKEVLNSKVQVVEKLDAATLAFLEQGGSVLLNGTKGALVAGKGGDIGIGFSSIFWNTAWTRGEKPTTLGILCDPNHPALADFPTQYHSNWQWWDAMTHSNAIILDEFGSELKPIVRVIDDWFENRSLGLLFETRVGNGKLLVSGIDLHTDLKNRIEAQQLLFSLKNYMSGDAFNPTQELDINKIKALYTSK
ncbi:sugar-binding domain-containing protein [Leeuwenhoekiella sp. MAR_2009_132]|uniref:sugar-binding domain-containing protein n=1 Tax=Leeuwenhoekiella sp. MAR_2009_132 TaxID=1392489 RepID=UPI00056D5FFA|nr:sugar-binding domain-containing protein [Leeuwenhoekiella sp. MAR_2009_132]